jgi:Coat F domain.
MNSQSDAASRSFSDQDMMKDMLSSQKFVTDSYNSYANECATPAIKSDFMSILNEEHQLQNQVFHEMNKRGWYPTEAADQSKINQVKQKYSNTAQ